LYSGRKYYNSHLYPAQLYHEVMARCTGRHRETWEPTKPCVILDRICPVLRRGRQQCHENVIISVTSWKPHLGALHKPCFLVSETCNYKIPTNYSVGFWSILSGNTQTPILSLIDFIDYFLFRNCCLCYYDNDYGENTCRAY
jgi:hypothetical protein